MPADDPVVIAATDVVQRGDLAALEMLLAEHRWLATARFGEASCYRSILHVATDWPGHFPNGPAVVACAENQRVAAEYLVDRDADLNWVGWDGLTPLDAAERAEATELAAWLRTRGGLRVSEIPLLTG